MFHNIIPLLCPDVKRLICINIRSRTHIFLFKGINWQNFTRRSEKASASKNSRGRDAAGIFLKSLHLQRFFLFRCRSRFIEIGLDLAVHPGGDDAEQHIDDAQLSDA